MYPRLFTGVRRIEILRTSALRSSKKFACIGFSQVQSNHHEKAIASSCSSPGTCALALPSFLLGLVSLRSLQGALEPRQSLVPHILLLASAQRREHLQRLYLVLLPAEPHPGPPSARWKVRLAAGVIGPLIASSLIFRLGSTAVQRIEASGAFPSRGAFRRIRKVVPASSGPSEDFSTDLTLGSIDGMLLGSTTNPNTSSTGLSMITLESIVLLSDPPTEDRLGHGPFPLHDASLGG